MKRFFALVLFFIIFVCILPLSVHLIMNIKSNKGNLKKIPLADEIKVFFSDKNTTESMNIEEYLCGVVAAEMPATFEKEALKAQAVAARSYAFYRMKNPSDGHPGAAVCTDYSHCKAYKTESELKEKWGNKSSEYLKKIEEAVYNTAGEVITYDGEVAMAVFHSQTGTGRTENSKDVWGGDVPYLVSVESHGENTAPNFYSKEVFSFEEFKEKLASVEPEIIIDSINEIGEAVLSEGGSVKIIQIGNKEFTGRNLRSIFGLRSSCFKIIADENEVTFEVTGYGHGVGMSQYGANTMAKEGYDYIQILTHYYTGTKIEGV